MIEGLGSYDTECLDQACGAKRACEIVTGDSCKFSIYDYSNSGMGSFVPNVNAPGDLAFGLFVKQFAYGNISSCLPEPQAVALLQGYGVGTSYDWCGLGHWYIVP